MNYDNLTTKELINYLDLTSTDPLVLRLIDLLKDESLSVELEEAGMDPITREFRDDGVYLSPAEYINQLQRDRDYYLDESDDQRRQIDSLEAEIKRLGTINLMNFIADVQHKMEMATMEKDRAVRRAEQERELRKEAEQKFEFWDKMNHGIR
jgi:hypothetical protein